MVALLLFLLFASSLAAALGFLLLRWGWQRNLKRVPGAKGRKASRPGSYLRELGRLPGHLDAAPAANTTDNCPPIDAEDFWK